LARSLGEVDVAVHTDAVVGEGPRWDVARGRLLWVDIERRELHVFDPGTGEDRHTALDERVGVGVPAESGSVLVALADRLALVQPDGSLRDLVPMPHGRQDMRLNDGACDPAGRFWVGSLALDFAQGAGALYRYADGALERALDAVTLSNGLGWSPDGRLMYYVDSLTYRVDVLDFDAASGEAHGRRPFVVLPRGSGVPDGLAVDDDGCVWLALYGRGLVQRYRADGELDAVLSLPVTNVTACGFGGDDGRSLFITTASQELTPDDLSRQPLAGSVFVADVGVAGPPARPFAG
jgi:sugar lactone lactonase YvrE